MSQYNGNGNENYQKYKERPRKEAYERYRNLSEEEKDKILRKVQDSYKSLSEKKATY